jgi:RNA polymerase sigma-54 factor
MVLLKKRTVMAEIRLLSSPQLKQNLYMKGILKDGLFMLELPSLQLETFLQQKSENNPLIEIEETYSPLTNHSVSYTDIPSHPKSFYEYLLHQAKLTIKNKEELNAAEEIIADLDDNGFYPFVIDCPIKKRVINIIKHFDPPGVGAKNLKESLLWQLTLKNKTNSLAYKIIDTYFDALLLHAHKAKYILKAFDPSLLKEAIKDIFSLCFSPKKYMSSSTPLNIYPDIFIWLQNNMWHIKVKSPHIKINEQYLALKDKGSIKNYLSEAKWLIKNLQKRKEILNNLAIYIIKNSYHVDNNLQENACLLSENSIGCSSHRITAQKKINVSIKKMAQDLHAHPSTIYRALKEKYVQINNEIFLLSSFFQRDLTKQNAIDILKKLLHDEQHPFSDKQLVNLLSEHNIKISRRTVAKYRNKLQIKSSYFRK